MPVPDILLDTTTLNGGVSCCCLSTCVMWVLWPAGAAVDASGDGGLSLLDGPLAELAGTSSGSGSSSKKGTHSTLQVGQA